MAIPSDRARALEIWPVLRDGMFEIKGIGAQVLRHEHLSIGQYLTLNWIRERGIMRSSEIARGLEISRPAATSLISSLEDRGWIVRHHSLVDRRGVAVRLTPRARSLLERVDREIGRAVRDAGQALSDAERESMLQSLEMVLEQLRARRAHDTQTWGAGGR